MRIPIFIRPVTEDEQHQIQAGLRSSDAFVLRRCQIVLASARGERAPLIAHQLGCDDQTVRNVIHRFNTNGLGVLHQGSSRPHRLRTAFTEEGAQQLKDLLHRSPREFEKERSTWTLELAAQVSFEQGIISVLVSDESVRRALKRLKTNWKRAKHWITSPDPHYLLKKTRAAFFSGIAALKWYSHQITTEYKRQEVLTYIPNKRSQVEKRFSLPYPSLSPEVDKNTTCEQNLRKVLLWYNA